MYRSNWKWAINSFSCNSIKMVLKSLCTKHQSLLIRFTLMTMEMKKEWSSQQDNRSILWLITLHKEVVCHQILLTLPQHSKPYLSKLLIARRDNITNLLTKMGKWILSQLLRQGNNKSYWNQMRKMPKFWMKQPVLKGQIQRIESEKFMVCFFIWGCENLVIFILNCDMV